MVDAVKEFLPNTEDFIASDQYAELRSLLANFLGSAKAEGFKDAVIASALVQSAVDHMAEHDPGYVYDWSMAHMKLLQDEHVKWLDLPKKRIIPRGARHLVQSTH